MARALAIQIEAPKREMSALIKKCHTLGMAEMPYLRGTFSSLLSRLAGEIGGRAPKSFAVSQKGVSVTAAGIAAKGSVSHPAAAAREFGRTTFYEGYTGRNMRSGRKVKRAGQRARPYIGIKGGGAIAAVAPGAKEEIYGAVRREWERIGE